MKEVENILDILKKTLDAVNHDTPFELRALSDKTIHTATISQDPDNIIVAVLVYSVGKILERKNYRRLSGFKEFEMILKKNLELAIKNLREGDMEKCRNNLGSIRNSVNKIDSDLRIYIKDVFEKAQVNKAFKMHEHGISSRKTAELLGVSLWDMAGYVGQSSLSEGKIAITMPIKKRVNIAEEFFR